MIVLGIDPSLTNFGWAITDTDAHGPAKCVDRGRFKTEASTIYIDRYVYLRECLVDLIRRVRPDRVGIEFPIFNDMYSEGMYGLFLFCSEALRREKQDVVFWSPGQIKSFARDLIRRPPGWVMDKPDMVEAAKVDTAKEDGVLRGAWNHNEADAYLCARLSSRFWLLYENRLAGENLTETERRLFLKVHTVSRGKRSGQTDVTGVLYREDERFFLWKTGETNGGEGSQGDDGGGSAGN